MDQIAATEIGRLLRNRMGLLIGPDMTMGANAYDDLAKSIAVKFDVEIGSTFLTTADHALEGGIPEGEIRDHISGYIRDRTPSPLLGHLCRGRWSAIFSASIDQNFEIGLDEEVSRRIARQPVTSIVDFTVLPPPRTTPVYKLLGSASRESFVYSSVQYLRQRTAWRIAAKSFADRVS